MSGHDISATPASLPPSDTPLHRRAVERPPFRVGALALNTARGLGRSFLAVAVVLLLVSVAAPPRAAAEPADYVLDPEHLTIAFLVDHAGFAKVLGRFTAAEGAFRFDEVTGELSNLAITVETESVDTQHRERDRHLRSADFLHSDRYPTMTFTADESLRANGSGFVINGELTLLGERRPLTLTATLNKSGEYPFGASLYAVGVSARGSFRRSEFGMTYGVDNGWVGDEVAILLEFEAQRRQ